MLVSLHPPPLETGSGGVCGSQHSQPPLLALHVCPTPAPSSPSPLPLPPPRAQGHRRHVRQFHRDEASGREDPDWSLGNFRFAYGTGGPADGGSGDASRAAASSAAASAAASGDGDYAAGRRLYVSHVFQGGQRCDEHGRQRETTVRFFCCLGAAPQQSAFACCVRWCAGLGVAAAGERARTDGLCSARRAEPLG